MNYNNGDKYDGEWKNDLREGNGIYEYKNGDKYKGEWKNDLRNGKGILYYKNGNIKYEGKYLNDKKDYQINIISCQKNQTQTMKKNKKN